MFLVYTGYIKSELTASNITDTRLKYELYVYLITTQTSRAKLVKGNEKWFKISSVNHPPTADSLAISHEQLLPRNVISQFNQVFINQGMLEWN